MYKVSFSLTFCKHITTFKSSAFLQHSPQHFRGTARRGMYNLPPCQMSMYCLSIGIGVCKLLSSGFSLWVIFFCLLQVLENVGAAKPFKVKLFASKSKLCNFRSEQNVYPVQYMIHVQSILCVGTLLWNIFQLFY